MIGFFDPDSLKIGETSASISFVNAADVNDVHEVIINSIEDAQRVQTALQDQLTLGITSLNGSYMKVQGTFTKSPGSHNEGIIVDAGKARRDGNREVPVRMAFDTKEGQLPDRGICIAVGEMVEGALMVFRITLAPISPIPAPVQSPAAPNS